jgi:hypothetical protein
VPAESATVCAHYTCSEVEWNDNCRRVTSLPDGRCELNRNHSVDLQEWAGQTDGRRTGQGTWRRGVLPLRRAAAVRYRPTRLGAASERKLDVMVHSMAFANREDLGQPFVDTSREGFKLALDLCVRRRLAQGCAELRRSWLQIRFPIQHHGDG